MSSQLIGRSEFIWFFRCSASPLPPSRERWLAFILDCTKANSMQEKGKVNSTAKETERERFVVYSEICLSISLISDTSRHPWVSGKLFSIGSEAQEDWVRKMRSINGLVIAFIFVYPLSSLHSYLFFKQEMELSLIGLQNAGKTSLVNVIATGGYSEDMIPTVGFNMRKVTKGNVTIKLWDLGGQPRFRSMWERYCRAVSAIVLEYCVSKSLNLLLCSYVVDAADHDNLSISKSELHDLLNKPSLSGIPLLVLGNKIDKPGALSKQALTDEMGLKSVTDREVCCYMISCKNSTNIDSVIDWLVKHSKSKS
ncbi:hypothetical protein RDI58_004450 [Solanum bulbocastanum]|uniref:ADP-ribosylation factor n=1 Tax=Solanum bulbocastanum TaxID=147425 RepID=A0AAN8YK46_SOLBU